MPPSIGLHDKKSEVPHDSRHQLGTNRSTPVPAKRNKSSSNGSKIARLSNDRIKSSVGFLRTKSVNDDLDQSSRDPCQQKTVEQASNQQLGPSRAKSLNKDLNQTTSASTRVAGLISELVSSNFISSRTKSLHTDLDQPIKDPPRMEKNGSKLPMHKARLTVIPPNRDGTSGGYSYSQRFIKVAEEKSVDNVPSLGLNNLIKSNKDTSCNDTTCSNGQIGCGVECRKVKTCDSTKELRCAYSKKNIPTSNAHSIADTMESPINSDKITEGSSSKPKSCENNCSTSQFEMKPNIKSSVISDHASTAVEPNAESKLSMLPSGFLDSSYRCAVRSVEDDYLTDIVSANNVSYRMPGEQKTVPVKSLTDSFIDHQIGYQIEKLTKEMNEESLSDAIIEDILTKDRLRVLTQLTQDEPTHTIRQDDLTSKKHTTNSQEPISNSHEILDGNKYLSQQSGYHCNPPKPPRLHFDEDEKLVTSYPVQFPRKQVCIPLTQTKIPQTFQQSKMEEHRSQQVKVQHYYALPSFSQSNERNVQSKIHNEQEFQYQTSEENIEKQRQIESLLSEHDDSCQTSLIMAARSTKDLDRSMVRSEVKEIESSSKSLDAISEQMSKSGDLPKVVGVQMKAPSARHSVIPVSKKNINKISPSRLSRFEQTNSSNSKKIRASKKRSSKRHSFFSPKMCLRNLCPCPSCSQNISTLESALLYHTGNLPHARSEDAVVASRLNQYIEAIFSGLDSNNTGFITEEQFVAMMRTLGCETHIPTDKTMKISSVDFPKRLWQCWSKNHYQTTCLEKPKARRPLLESILSSKSDIETMENLSEQLEDINTSMKSVSSSGSIESTNVGQGLGQRLWQNKQRDIARSKENRYLKDTVKDLRSALLRLGVENLILRVKIQLESPGNTCSSATTGRCSTVQRDGEIMESEALSNGENTDQTHCKRSSIEECSKGRKHKCPDVHLRCFTTEQKQSPFYDSKLTSSDDGSNTKIHTESSEGKSKITSSDDNSCELYLPMNAHSSCNVIIREQASETNGESNSKRLFTEFSKPMYANYSGPFYEENPIYCTIIRSNDDLYESMAIKSKKDLRRRFGSEMTNFQSSLADADKEEEVSSFESDTESPPRLIRSYGSKSSMPSSSRSKARLSYSTRSNRSSRIRRTSINARPKSDCPPPLPTRRYVSYPTMSSNKDPPKTLNHLSLTSFGMPLEDIDSAIPRGASTPRSENKTFSQLYNRSDNLQNPEVRLVRPQHNSTQSIPTPRTSVSSVTSTDKSTNYVDALRPRNSQSSGTPSYQSHHYYQHQGTVSSAQDINRKSDQSRESVTESQKCSGEDVRDFDPIRGASKISDSIMKTPSALNIPRKTGRDQKTPKKTISGKSRITASVGKLLNKMRF